jgi:hypothetical protein
MILKNLTALTILALTTSGCSLLGTKQIEIIAKPIEIEIMQPALPRPVDLTAPYWHVVSEAKITNPCRKVDDKRPKACAKEDTENPDWPVGYSYLDRFMDEMREQNNGEIVFVATTIGDYKVMAEDMQELKRYINQLGEVIIYYRDVTMSDGQKGVGVAIDTGEK